MNRDIRRKYDKWLARQKGIDRDVKAALMNPLNPPVTRFVIFYSTVYDIEYVNKTVPEELRTEAYFRVERMHNAVMKQIEAYTRDISTYAFMGPNSNREAIEKLVKELLDKIQRMSDDTSPA